MLLGKADGRKYGDLLSPNDLVCWVHSLTIRKKHVVAVFQIGWSFPNFDGEGQSYFSLIGIEYA
jgi:hypothetical protein